MLFSYARCHVAAAELFFYVLAPHKMTASIKVCNRNASASNNIAQSSSLLASRAKARKSDRMMPYNVTVYSKANNLHSWQYTYIRY